MRAPMRAAGGRLPFGLGALLLVAHAAVTAPQSIGDCPGVGKTAQIGDKKRDFCISETTPRQVWMKPQAGQNFEPMAQFCCLNQEAVVATWRRERPDPAVDQWYPVRIDDLKPEILAQLTSRSGRDESADAVDPEADSEERPNPELDEGVQTSEPLLEETPATGSEEKRVVDANGGFDRSLVIYALLFFLAAVGLLVAVVVYVWKREPTRRRGDVPPAKNPTASNGGAAGAITETQSEQVKQLAPILAAALAPALEQALKSMAGQRITIELAPPAAARTADWISFLRTVKQELDRPTTPAGGAWERGAQRSGWQEPETGGMPSPPPGPRVGTGRQLYAIRATYYGDGSNNFGGRPVFTEISDRTAAFCIRVEEGGYGWLTPNFEAREFDPLYHTIFGLSRPDFFNGSQASPQQVRSEGGQWVLVSQR